MKNNIWIALAFVLLAANLLLLSIFLIRDRGRPSHPHHPPHGPHHENFMSALIARRLHFDSRQKAELESFSVNRIHHHALRDSLDQLKVALFTLGAQGLLKSSERDSLLNRIGNMHQNLDLLMLRYFEHIRSICSSPEQRKEFDLFAEELVMKTLRRGPPPPQPNLTPDD